MFIFNTDLLLIDVGLAKAVLVFFVSLIAMLLFAAATQGYFIAKSKRWETVVILFIVFMLFRPDFWLDQWKDKYTKTAGPAAIEAIDEVPNGSPIRIIVSAPDFDTGIVGQKTIVMTPETEGSGEARLQSAGLSVFPEGNLLLLDEPFPGTPYFEALANDYDFYGDEPAQIVAVEIENDRPPKEIFFIPALLMMLFIAWRQSRRATQAPF